LLSVMDLICFLRNYLSVGSARRRRQPSLHSR
jgi:hypothetical protein